MKRLLLSPALEAAVIAGGAASDSSSFPSSLTLPSARDGAGAALASAQGPEHTQMLAWAGLWVFILMHKASKLLSPAQTEPEECPKTPPKQHETTLGMEEGSKINPGMSMNKQPCSSMADAAPKYTLASPSRHAHSTSHLENYNHTYWHTHAQPSSPPFTGLYFNKSKFTWSMMLQGEPIAQPHSRHAGTMMHWHQSPGTGERTALEYCCPRINASCWENKRPRLASTFISDK